MKKILVVGGAGYIGSHMVKMLLAAGFSVVTLDNLVTGYRDAVVGGDFVHGDLNDRPLLDRLFSEHDFAAVMHFASYIQVGESVSEPSKYYRNNVSNSLNLLDAMLGHEVKAFIFSSSAAIFGEPAYIPIDEDHPKQPLNPYGRSKWIIEQALADYDRAYGLKSVCLRYFNAAGADPEGMLGERHDPETHLIPLVLQAAAGIRPNITVFGQNYDTPDGTCIRDYIHVADLCQAHLLALEKLWENRESVVLNLGNGFGFSIEEIIMAARQITGRTIAVEYASRRAGDPARLVADSRHAKEYLGWAPNFPQIESIIEHAWRFHLRHKFYR